MTKNTYLILVLIFIIFVVGCQETPFPSTSTHAPETTETALVSTNYAYDVHKDEQKDIRVSGSVFDVPTNNCGATTNAFESFTGEHEFNISLDLEFSNELQGKLGGNFLIANAEIEAVLEHNFGVQVDTIVRKEAERQIITPPDSRTVVTLQWEEIWDTGSIMIKNVDGNEIGTVPFEILTTLRLSQLAVNEIPCNTPGVLATPTPTATPIPEAIEKLIGSWNIVAGGETVVSRMIKVIYKSIQFFSDGLGRICAETYFFDSSEQEYESMGVNCASGTYDSTGVDSIRLVMESDGSRLIMEFRVSFEGDMVVLHDYAASLEFTLQSADN